LFVRHLPAAEPTRSLPLGDTWKDGHVRDKHVKDAAQDVAEDVTQDAAEDVFGAAEDVSSICQRRKDHHHTRVLLPTAPGGSLFSYTASSRIPAPGGR